MNFRKAYLTTHAHSILTDNTGQTLTFHDVRPDNLFNPGSLSEQSITSTVPKVGELHNNMSFMKTHEIIMLNHNDQ